MIEQALEWISAHPLAILAILFFVYQLYAKSKPYPEFPDTKVKSVHSVDDVTEICSKLSSGYLILDFYATWCPPCKAAAPVFHQWANQYSENDFVFAKVDVDKSRDVARKYQISAMPTFVVLDNKGSVIKSYRGWRRSEIETFLSEKTK